MDKKDYRIRVKRLIRVCGSWVVCLQRKMCLGWRTTAYYYPSSLATHSKQDIESLLLIQEEQNARKPEKYIAMSIKYRLNL